MLLQQCVLAELTGWVGCPHKYHCLHREEVLAYGLISIVLRPTGLTSPSNCTGRGKKESKTDRKSKKGQKWKRPPTLTLTVPTKTAIPPGISPKYARMLEKSRLRGKKTPKTKNQKSRTKRPQDNEEIGVFNHSGKVSKAYLRNESSLLYFNPCKMFGWTICQWINENLLLYSVVHRVD